VSVTTTAKSTRTSQTEPGFVGIVTLVFECLSVLWPLMCLTISLFALFSTSLLLKLQYFLLLSVTAKTGAGKLGRSKLGLRKVGLRKLGSGKVGR